jgi:hypothetical protein
VSTTPRSWAAKAIVLSGSVYGTILASSIIVALSYKEHGSALVMIAALAVTEFVFTAAHAWSALLASGHARGALPSPADVVHALRHEWPVLQATWPAMLALTLAAVGVYSANTGVNLALVANAVILFLWGLGLAWLQDIPLPLAIAAGVVTCGLGVALVALKVMVH